MVRQIPTKFVFLIFRYSSGVELKAKQVKPNLDNSFFFLLYVPKRKAKHVFNNSGMTSFFKIKYQRQI